MGRAVLIILGGVGRGGARFLPEFGDLLFQVRDHFLLLDRLLKKGYQKAEDAVRPFDQLLDPRESRAVCIEGQIQGANDLLNSGRAPGLGPQPTNEIPFAGAEECSSSPGRVTEVPEEPQQRLRSRFLAAGPHVKIVLM